MDEWCSRCGRLLIVRSASNVCNKCWRIDVDYGRDEPIRPRTEPERLFDRLNPLEVRYNVVGQIIGVGLPPIGG